MDKKQISSVNVKNRNDRVAGNKYLWKRLSDLRETKRGRYGEEKKSHKCQRVNLRENRYDFIIFFPRGPISTFCDNNISLCRKFSSDTDTFALCATSVALTSLGYIRERNANEVYFGIAFREKNAIS